MRLDTPDTNITSAKSQPTMARRLVGLAKKKDTQEGYEDSANQCKTFHTIPLFNFS